MSRPAKRGPTPRPRDTSPHVRADEPGLRTKQMKAFALIALFAASLIVSIPAHAGSCQTTCYGSAAYRTCQTNCW
jgi:hypothetical protein